MAGRKPKPTKLHVIHGNPSRKKLNTNEPEPAPVKNPSPPKHLDAIAAYLWRMLCVELESLGILGRIDLKALERYCECYSTWRDAQKMRSERGVVVEKKQVVDGVEIVVDVKTAPWVTVAAKMSAEMRAIETATGMGGAANRARVKVNDPKDGKSAADKFRARKRS